MSTLIKPQGYKAILDTKQTEQGIKLIKEFFQQNLSTELRLRRVTAPLFVLQGLGINDDLNGVERPVTFPIKDLGDAKAEVVHSLAKWKRLTLAEYGIEPGYGIYTDMNAIRADEELDNIGDDGFFRDGLIELLTLCPALDGDDGLVDVVVHGNDENNDEQNAGNHADAVIKQ